MNRFKLLYFVIFVINLCRINAQISDKRLCVDQECKVPISHAKTLLRYSSPDSRILSFAPNADIIIYSKSAGSREDLWGGEINGKRGYVPKHMVRETKVLQKATLLVDTEFSNDTESTQVPSQVEPDKVQEPYEVVDGTTIYLNPQEINPTSTDSPVQPTALPVETNKIEGSVNSQTPTVDTIDNTVQSPTEEKPSQTQDNNDQNLVTNEEEKPAENEQVAAESTEIDIDDEEIASEDDEADEDVDDDDVDDEEEEEEAEEVSEDVPDVDEQEQDSVEGVNTLTENEDTATAETSNLNNVEIEVKSEDEAGTVSSKESELLSETVKQESEKEETTSNEDTKPEVPSAPTNVPEVPVVEEKVEDTQAAVAPGEPSTEETLDNKESELSSKEETVQLNEDTSTEATPAPVEVTTLIPEIEVPQPFADQFEVTPNPLEATEEPKVVTETISALPPLGLFGASNVEAIVSQVITESEENATEVQIDEAKSAEVQFEQNSAEVVEDVGNSTESEETVVEENASKESIEEVAENSSSSENEEIIEETQTVGEESADSGFFAGVMSLFGTSEDSVAQEKAPEELTIDDAGLPEHRHVDGDDLLSSSSRESFCDATSCLQSEENEIPIETIRMDFFNFNSDVFLYLVTTAISVIIFLFGYIAFDKSKREGPLIARINNLEKKLLVVLKENEILQEKVATESGYETNDRVSNEVVENLQQDLSELAGIKNALEEQVQSLEKELENSTEVGMELNRMLSEILSSESGSDVLKANVEHLQRQLVEQQSTINSVNETLAVTNTENHELRLELDLSNKKVLDLQSELDKLLLNILKIEEEKDSQQSTLEGEIANLRQKYEEMNAKARLREEDYNNESKQLKTKLQQSERKLQLKTKEHGQLAATLKQLKTLKNDETTLQKLLEVGAIKAELQLLKNENQGFTEKIQRAEELKVSHEKHAQAAVEEIRLLKDKYDEADKLRVEMQTKLEVLSNYFKDREAQWQREISKHEALWAEKEGEATSTTERIKFMQEQLQNYKAQTDSLKQEIMSQEIELKSQISVLEKKAHENWVSARQAERKLEEAKQEAAQLRHRLTLRERAIQEDKNQHRLQSPIEQNGDIPVSPLDSPASPPLLYGARDHITKSPPLPGLPPFLPPPGVPFMPPPIHGVPPFIPPPPPNLFPGDHRPPPLGRMSSPPLNSRYSPSSRGYSPYDRNSSSPSDSEYGTSPPHRRGYSPFNNRSEERREYKRPPPGRSNGRNLVKGGGSSGSGHSNESLEKISRQQSKV